MRLTCARCKVDFASKWSGRKYCSRTCSGESRKNGKTFNCGVCGASTYAQGNRPKARFCSPECHNVHQSRNKVRLACLACNQQFLVSPSCIKFDAAEYCGVRCWQSTPKAKAMLLAGNEKQMRSAGPNRLERVGAELLQATGFDFPEQQRLFGKFTVDAVADGLPIVVQWDGDYWHGHKAITTGVKPDARVAKRMALDRSQDAFMAAAGVTVVRAWEHEVNRQPEQIVGRIVAAIRSRMEVGPLRPINTNISESTNDTTDPF